MHIRIMLREVKKCVLVYTRSNESLFYNVFMLWGVVHVCKQLTVSEWTKINEIRSRSTAYLSINHREFDVHNVIILKILLVVLICVCS